MRDREGKLDARTAFWLRAVYASWRQKIMGHNKCVREREAHILKKARQKKEMRMRMRRVMILAENVEV
jgi:hypothetical protein